MLRWERIHIDLDAWEIVISEFADRTVFHSSPWLRFLKHCFCGELVFAVLHNGHAICGYFAGMMVTRLGLRILGSPLPGWSTSYMGPLLSAGVSRFDAVAELKRFAFEDLRCVHMELMDRKLASTELDSQYAFREYNGFEIDLSLDEDALFARFDPACRRCIRKSIRSKLTIEVASDPQFAYDYYAQLRDVFSKQGLSPTYDLGRVQALIACLRGTGNLLLLRARDSEGRCIATGIFPGMNDRAYFWGGASWRQYQHLRPNEALMWHAIRYWKQRGVGYFDMSGGGDYKRKYGGREITVPWVRSSRYPILEFLRDGARRSFELQQRIRGTWHRMYLGVRTSAALEPSKTGSPVEKSSGELCLP